MSVCWKPSSERIKQSNMYQFLTFVQNNFDGSITTYDELYRWSIDNPQTFWGELWKYFSVIEGTPFTNAVDDVTKMPGARWFTGGTLNFAENLLKYRDDKVALTFIGEGRESVHLTYKELYEKVISLATALRNDGIKPGDRVAAFVSNQIETVIAMLATTAIGAIWSSCSPDFGIEGVYDRFSQITPRILFTVDAYQYNGKTFDALAKVVEITKRVPSIEKTVVIPYCKTESTLENSVQFNEYLSVNVDGEFKFEHLPADHPVYIMYSSGTTGVPKCIVHSAGGTLIQHLKELVLHTDLKREDSIMYFTTCGWMMWNWLVSSLAVGSRVVLYDGSTFYPDKYALWNIIDKEQLTVFGTSAKYIAAIEKEGLNPMEHNDLGSLKAILSTGSPLSEESFDYVYASVKKDVQLASISGGTDIISCFALGNPLLPVNRGEIQCRGLGMKVEAFDSEGKPTENEKGELVCCQAAPSMPISFWNDPEDKKYKDAYFSEYENIWYHGDYTKITPEGGVVIYGRSDTTLNPGGVRIGTAEIYRQVETVSEVKDSLVVGYNSDGDVEVILFVKMQEGIELTEERIVAIKKQIRANTTPRHVPSRVIAVPDIPYTISGKKVEIAVKKLIHKESVKNKDALANPESLYFFQEIDMGTVGLS